MKTIYSIGHSNKKIEELIDILKENGITDLVDVRTYPTSKYNPQFKRENIERSLEGTGIKYHWRGRNLGGLGGNTLFKETLEKMLEASSDERRLCVMCSESDPADCHRTQTIEPVIHELGGKMEHILWRGGKGSDKIRASEEEQNNTLF